MFPVFEKTGGGTGAFFRLQNKIIKGKRSKYVSFGNIGVRNEIKDNYFT